MMEEAEYSFAAKSQLAELKGGKDRSKEGDTSSQAKLITLQATQELIDQLLKNLLEKIIILRDNRNNVMRENQEWFILPVQKKNYCMVYNLLNGQKQLQQLNINFTSYFAFLNLSDCALVAGGQNTIKSQNTDLFFELRFNRAQPILLPALLTPKRRMGICVESELETDVFIVGGHDGKTQMTAVDRFERQTQKWFKEHDLNVKRHGPACIGLQLGRYVLAIGGYNLSSESLSSVERYDRKNPGYGWELIKNVTNKQRYQSACAWGEGRTILLFGGMTSVTTYLMKYNEDLNSFNLEDLHHDFQHYSYGEKNVCGFKRFGKDVFATDDQGSLRVLQPKGWLAC